MILLIGIVKSSSIYTLGDTGISVVAILKEYIAKGKYAIIINTLRASSYIIHTYKKNLVSENVGESIEELWYIPEIIEVLCG